MGVPGILKGEGMQCGISNEKSISFADQGDAQGEVAHNYNDNVSSEAAGVSGPTGSANDTDSGVAGEGAALGHAAAARPNVVSDSDDVDLLGSTGSDSS